jgi:uncharacterized protein
MPSLGFKTMEPHYFTPLLGFSQNRLMRSVDIALFSFFKRYIYSFNVQCRFYLRNELLLICIFNIFLFKINFNEVFMLISYAFSNFQSFRERTNVDFTVGRKNTLTNWIRELPNGDRLSKLMAVIGANGSGKTTLLKPLAFLHWFTSESFKESPTDTIPLHSFVGNASMPTEFEIHFFLDGHFWRYELSCTRDKVQHEALYKKVERFGYVFKRDWDTKKKRYNIKQQDFGLVQGEAEKVRGNASLIATAAQYNVPLARRLASLLLITNITIGGRTPIEMSAVLEAAQHMASSKKHLDTASKLLARWDLGLSGIRLMKWQEQKDPESDTPIWIPMGMHEGSRGAFQLSFGQESSGTQSAFVLLSKLLPVLESGGVAVIDELENDLHPHMLEPILDLFANPKSNPHDAQLIFTSHALEVLNLLHKSQVMLVEKDEHCESSACRLDRVEGIRNDDNFYAKYMAGAYGAIPSL